jgi:DNA-binding NarL/FixJ family response regulator
LFSKLEKIVVASKEEFRDTVETTTPVRVMVVDDYKRWHGVVSTTLQSGSRFQIIANVYDGAEAVHQAKELQPDLILLDIGLPTLNGIEVARRVREVAPNSMILFVSQETSRDVAREALATGASGYVVKSDVGKELRRAVDAVLAGERFVSSTFADQDFSEAADRCSEMASGALSQHAQAKTRK